MSLDYRNFLNSLEKRGMAQTRKRLTAFLGDSSNGSDASWSFMGSTTLSQQKVVELLFPLVRNGSFKDGLATDYFAAFKGINPNGSGLEYTARILNAAIAKGFFSATLAAKVLKLVSTYSKVAYEKNYCGKAISHYTENGVKKTLNYANLDGFVRLIEEGFESGRLDAKKAGEYLDALQQAADKKLDAHFLAALLNKLVLANAFSAKAALMAVPLSSKELRKGVFWEEKMLEGIANALASKFSGKAELLLKQLSDKAAEKGQPLEIIEALEKSTKKKVEKLSEDFAKEASKIHDEVIALCEKNKQKQALELLEPRMPALKELYNTRMNPNDARLFLLNDYFYAALGAKEYERAAKWADDSNIQELSESNPFVFHNTACVYAKLGKLKKALDQVKKAKKFNYPYMDKIASDTELTALYDNPEFKKATERE